MAEFYDARCNIMLSKTYLTDDISKEALLDIFSQIYALHQPGEFLD